MYRTSGTFVGLLLLGLLCSTVMKETAAFQIEDAREHIKEIVTYLYSNVLKETVPSFNGVEGATTVDGLDSEASSLLPDDKVESIKGIVKDYTIDQLEPLSEAATEYIRVYAGLLSGEPDIQNKSIPLKAKLQAISEVYASELYGKPKPGADTS
ncbi:uncharacterized protein LOC135848727 [Planococcus citri]|uniref:uncharacterized protein LOC135848727 n=1 Tax=Planococcus citri TaxID=170843 RepID=UPI0031F98FD7